MYNTIGLVFFLTFSKERKVRKWTTIKLQQLILRQLKRHSIAESRGCDGDVTEGHGSGGGDGQ